MTTSSDPNAAKFAELDHYDAVNIAAVLEDNSPAIRNAFMRSGSITPGVVATADLHKDTDIRLGEFHDYVQARVAADARGPIKNWCGA